MKYLIILLCFLAGLCKAVCDTLTFHWGSSIFKKWGWNELFWNPNVSWKNKYANWPEDKSEAFFLSKTLFVAFTDAWHLFDLLLLLLLFSVFFLPKQKPLYYVISVISFFISLNLFYYTIG